MMTAAEARIKSNTVTDERVDKELTSINELIESACNGGKRVVYTSKRLDSAVCDRLKGLGYAVSSHSDPIEEWTQISW